MTLFEMAKDPEKTRLIELLYEGYRVPYEELLKELGIPHKKLDHLLDATEGLWDTPRPNVYKLTQREQVVYGIVKSRNVRVKDKREADAKKREGGVVFKVCKGKNIWTFFIICKCALQYS
jgi:hypothetical protein